MAAIDKTYVTLEQYNVLKEWAKDKICVLYNGYESPVKNWIIHWEDDSFKESIWGDDTLPCWNTSSWQDRWLYQNCPLDFIQNRLLQQYGEKGLKDLIAPIPSRGKIAKHFKVVSKPQFKDKSPNGWWSVSITGPDFWWYNTKGDYWAKHDEYLPSNSSHAHLKNFNLRKFRRKLIKWNLPVGLRLIISGRYVRQYYIIDTYE